MISASPDLAALQESLGVRFHDVGLLTTALTHSSYANEHPFEDTGTNERLEFLGDAVLGLVAAEALYARFPDEDEGRLTEWRAQLVMGPTLARVAETLQLGAVLRLGRGEETSGGRARERNLARVYEAVVGAIMLDHGLETARDFVFRTMAEEFDALDGDQFVVNPKGVLQQLTQGDSGRPEYVLVSAEGPEHARAFTVEVRIDDRVVGAGHGASKQLAEKDAARAALRTLLDDVRRSLGPPGGQGAAGRDSDDGDDDGDDGDGGDDAGGER